MFDFSFIFWKILQGFFLCKSCKGNLNYQIPKKYNLLILDDDEDINIFNETNLIKNYFNKNLDILVIDNYSIDKAWENNFLNFASKIIVIDDLANRIHSCHYLIDQNFYIRKNRYKGLLPKNCKTFLGPKFSIIDDIYLIKQKFLLPNIFTISIFFGASDNGGLTLKTLETLIELSKNFDFQVNVVVGPNNLNIKSIKKLCVQQDYNLYTNIPNMLNIYKLSTIFIGSAGISFVERSFLNIPSILYSFANNQIETSKDLSKAKIAFYMGNYLNYKSDALKKIIKHYFDNHDKLLLIKSNLNLNYSENLLKKTLAEIVND